MTREKKLLGILLALFFVVCLLGLTDIALGFQNMPTKNQISDVSIGMNGISFRPKLRSRALVLTVSIPDGSIFRKSFEAGSTPYYELSATSPDGVYNQIRNLNLKHFCSFFN